MPSRRTQHRRLVAEPRPEEPERSGRAVPFEGIVPNGSVADASGSWRNEPDALATAIVPCDKSGATRHERPPGVSAHLDHLRRVPRSRRPCSLADGMIVVQGMNRNDLRCRHGAGGTPRPTGWAWRPTGIVSLGGGDDGVNPSPPRPSFVRACHPSSPACHPSPEGRFMIEPRDLLLVPKLQLGNGLPAKLRFAMRPKHHRLQPTRRRGLGERGLVERGGMGCSVGFAVTPCQAELGDQCVPKPELGNEGPKV